MKIRACAKINLSLDIIGIRMDGYHEILTIMQSLEWHDLLDMAFSSTGDIRVESSDPRVPSGSDNLVYKAAELIQREYGCNHGAKIFIEKNIPLSAGLAGGSTDAAAALRSLSKLWGLNISEGELLSLGERLGADVPFCLLGNTALAGGKGETLTPLAPFSGFGVVLVKPPFDVSTAMVYRLHDSFPTRARFNTEALVRAVEDRNLSNVASLMENALERVTVSLYPEILDIKNKLIAAGAMGAMMSGSGPTVFGLCHSRQEAKIVASRLKLPGCRIIATATL